MIQSGVTARCEGNVLRSDVAVGCDGRMSRSGGRVRCDGQVRRPGVTVRCDGEVRRLLFRDVEIVMLLTTLRLTDKVLPSGVANTIRREISSWIYGRMRFLRG